MTEIKSVYPRTAWAVLQEHPEAMLIDVRARFEFNFIGHAPVAVNIPWKELPNWQLNPSFLETVRAMVPDLNRPLLLMCRSGQRSREAAQALAAIGYTDLSNIEEGFEGPLDANKQRSSVGGWRFHGLPWEQS